MLVWKSRVCSLGVAAWWMFEGTGFGGGKNLLTWRLGLSSLLPMLDLVVCRGGGPVQQLEKVMVFGTFDPTSVYAGVGAAFEGALVVAASLTAALIIYRWVRRVFGR